MGSLWTGLDAPVLPTWGGGQATLGDIAGASLKDLWYVDNTNASMTALEQAYDDRRAEVKRLTGENLDNPIRQAESDSWAFKLGVPSSIVKPASLNQRMDEFQARLDAIQQQFPDQQAVAGITRSIEGEAANIARQSDQQLATDMQSRPGWSKYLANFAGGVAGSLRDPVQMGLLFLGGGAAAGRTAMQRILWTAGREALINGAGMAAMQPSVQAWRKELGLPSGLGEAARNVAFGTLLGAAFGAGAQGLSEGVSRLAGPALDAEAARLAEDPNVAPAARDMLAPAPSPASAKAAAETLPAIREDLPPAARGALDQAETTAHFDSLRPADIAPDTHDAALAAAGRAAAADAPRMPAFEPDAQQVSRVVDTLLSPPLSSSQEVVAGGAPELRGTPAQGRAKPATEPQSLASFLIGHGGVQDFQGELKAIGADKVSEKFRGRLVKDAGMTLDHAREAAAEAGYLDARYGSAQAAMEKSTVADLLDLLDQDLRGKKVYPAGDLPDAAAEADRAMAESAVHAAAQAAGPGVADAELEQIATLIARDGLDPQSAVEEVFSRSEPVAGRPVVKGFFDTRGEGAQYHGSPSAIDGLQEGAYSSLNYYGQGFYTSDAIDITHGYANRRGAKMPTVYRVTEKHPVKLFDMEQKVPDWLVKDDLDNELVDAALAEHPPSVRALYDEMRAASREMGYSADAVQEIFDSFTARFEDHGYGGLAHVGGLRTNNPTHQVKIYFDPRKDLTIEPVDLAPFRAPKTAGERSGEPLPGWSDAELEKASQNRPNPPTAHEGIDEPGKVESGPQAAAYELTPAELERYGNELVPDANGELVPLSRYADEIASEEDLAALVEMCKG